MDIEGRPRNIDINNESRHVSIKNVAIVDQVQQPIIGLHDTD